MTKKLFFLLLLANFLVVLGVRYLVPPPADESARYSGGNIQFLTSAERAALSHVEHPPTAVIDASSTEDMSQTLPQEGTDSAPGKLPEQLQSTGQATETVPEAPLEQIEEEPSEGVAEMPPMPSQDQVSDQAPEFAPAQSLEQAQPLARNLIPEIDPAQVREEILERAEAQSSEAGPEPSPKPTPESPSERVEEQTLEQEGGPADETVQEPATRQADEQVVDQVPDTVEAFQQEPGPIPEVQFTEVAQRQIPEPADTPSPASDQVTRTVAEPIPGQIQEQERVAEQTESATLVQEAAPIQEQGTAQDSEPAHEQPFSQIPGQAPGLIQEQVSESTPEAPSAEAPEPTESAEELRSEAMAETTSEQPRSPVQDQEPERSRETAPQNPLDPVAGQIQDPADKQTPPTGSDSESGQTQNRDEDQEAGAVPEDAQLPVQEQAPETEADKASDPVVAPEIEETVSDDDSATAQRPEDVNVSDQGCRALGPLESRTAAEAFLQELENRDLPGVLRTGALRETRSYLVLIPTDSKAEAAGTMRRLLEAGHKDVWLLTTGEHKGKVSVGLFRSESNAALRLSQVGEDGFVATIVPRIAERPAFWVDLNAEISQLVTPELLDELRKTYPQVSSEPGQCPGSSL